MTDFDSQLARFSRQDAQVWCENPRCQLHDDGADVEYESENGYGTYKPSECWECGGGWVDEKPEREPLSDPEIVMCERPSCKREALFYGEVDGPFEWGGNVCAEHSEYLDWRKPLSEVTS